MDDVYTKLRIEARSGGKVREVAEFLSALENAYNNLYAIDFFVSSLEDLDRKRRYLRHPQYPIPFERIEGLILPEDELRLDSVIIESPGWWEVLGIPKLLETLRKYLNDRHERKKDSEFRNKYEERKKELGLEKNEDRNI
jgi:hypothetical protein